MPIHGYPGNVITANPTAPTVSSASGVWTTEQQLLAVSQGNWPGYEYPISRSLRFNSADSAYLNRTFTTPTDTKKFTWSGWVKRGSVGVATNWILSATPDAYTTYVNFGFVNGSGGSVDYLTFDQYTGSYVVRATTNAIYRDTSAWYHIVLVWDSANATSTDRTQIWVNGLRTTVTYAFGPVSQNTSSVLNANNSVNYLGRLTSNYFNGYMTEVNFIDGQALEPSSFGLNDPETGVWSPKRYTGTYGTNGFYLNFSDNSGTTSTTLGKDSSGNGNNFTPNNFSVTAGAGNDSLVDSPTSYGTDTGVGGEVRGNYATLSPVSSSSLMTLANGNLDVTSGTTAANGNAYSTISPLTGKFYAEVRVNTGSNADMIGVCPNTLSNSSGRFDTLAGGIGYYSDGQKYVAGVVSNYGSSYTTNDIIGIALDMDAQTVTFYKNNVSQGTISSSMTANVGYYFVSSDASSGNGINHTWNFGQRAFAYTAPSGFKALCTQNLPTPTIGATSTTQANDYFDISLYTGNGTSQSITGLGFQPDFIWFKGRNTVTNHAALDAVRGRSKIVFPSLTDPEATSSTTSNDLVSFNANGFSVGIPEQSGSINTNGTNVVAWCWNAGGSTVTNTSGTISAQVRASTTAGFSVVTWTGNGSSNQTIGHGLGVTPGMIIVKARTQASATNWRVWHKNLSGSTSYLGLNQTAAEAISSTVFNGQSSTTFTVGTDPAVNANTYTFVAYCFAPVAGYSAFGSYLANASTDGPFIFCGFRPRFIMIKGSVAGNNWVILDTARDTYNVAQNLLYPNLSNAEAAGAALDILSNGFKIRASGGDVNFSSGATYIYAAFAESPFKYALAR